MADHDPPGGGGVAAVNHMHSPVLLLLTICDGLSGHVVCCIDVLTLQRKDALPVLLRHFGSTVFKSVEACFAYDSLCRGHVVYLLLESVYSEHGVVKTLTLALLVSKFDIIALWRNLSLGFP